MQTLSALNSRQYINPNILKPIRTNTIGFSAMSFFPPVYPNLKQNDEYSCGPFSATNALIYLSQKGYPNLNSSTITEDLKKHFKSDNNGTTSDNMCKGLESYIKEKGYTPKSIEYQGIRPVDGKYNKGLKPDMDKIKSAIDSGKVVLLNFGVYEKDEKNSVYTRKWGHWVTAAGRGFDGHQVDSSCITVRDPYDPFKKNELNTYLKFKEIKQGKMLHNKDDNEKVLTDNAAGLYEMPHKPDYFYPNEVGILNGAIILDM